MRGARVDESLLVLIEMHDVKLCWGKEREQDSQDIMRHCQKTL